jgi:hypothetical protein
MCGVVAMQYRRPCPSSAAASYWLSIEALVFVGHHFPGLFGQIHAFSLNGPHHVCFRLGGIDHHRG